jgi:carbonic anhydrase
MPDRAEATWTEMVRRHAEVASAPATSNPPSGELPPHRPKAAILACSDARVPPSLLFGQEPGSLFVVRLAGNSATPGAVASLTYAVDHLGVELVVVLGHTGCGAVEAALDGSAPATLAPILTPINEMLASCSTCDSMDAAVFANVRHNVARLRRDRGPLGQAVSDGRATVVGAVHDLTRAHLVDVDPSLDARPGRPHRSDAGVVAAEDQTKMI